MLIRLSIWTRSPNVIRCITMDIDSYKDCSWVTFRKFAGNDNEFVGLLTTQTIDIPHIALNMTIFVFYTKNIQTTYCKWWFQVYI